MIKFYVILTQDTVVFNCNLKAVKCCDACKWKEACTKVMSDIEKVWLKKKKKFTVKPRKH